MPDAIITLAHGGGGRASQRLIDNYVRKYFSNEVLDRMEDGAVLPEFKNAPVLTTDTFVVSPLFFSGGDIGRLAVCGTVNDISAMGAKPLYLTCGLVIEEGMKISLFEKILKSMKKTADEAGVKIVAGDTKVVEKGRADGIYINTAGLGEVIGGQKGISVSNASEGDVIIVTGGIGEHEISVLKEREGIGFESDIKSDCAPLSGLVSGALSCKAEIKAMRDPTRGGLAAVLNEIASASGVNMEIDEEKIPVSPAVQSACSILGLDILNLASEGKMAIIAGKDGAKELLESLKKNRNGKNAAIIGKVLKKSGKPSVTLNTKSGGKRIILTGEGEHLPRIC